MGKHYRKESKKSRIIKITILFLLAAAALYAAAAFVARHERRPSVEAPISTSADKDEEKVAEKEDFGERYAGGEKRADNEHPSVEKKELEEKATTAFERSADKKISQGQKRAAYEEPEERKYSGPLPLLAIIVDDGGFRLDYAKRAATLSLPLTWAIIPYQPCSKKMLELAKEKEIPALLHLPMQAITDRDASRYIIGKGMSAGEVRKKTADALASLSGVIGVNNHRGSMSTADDSLMSPFLDELKERSLIFVDSRTIGSSVAYAAARKKGVPALKNGGFIDNVSDKKAIETAFANVLPAAKKKGHLVIICHFRPATLLFLEELDKKYENLPVRFVTVPEMIELLDAQGEERKSDISNNLKKEMEK